MASKNESLFQTRNGSTGASSISQNRQVLGTIDDYRFLSAVKVHNPIKMSSNFRIPKGSVKINREFVLQKSEEDGYDI